MWYNVHVHALYYIYMYVYHFGNLWGSVCKVLLNTSYFKTTQFSLSIFQLLAILMGARGVFYSLLVGAVFGV